MKSGQNPAKSGHPVVGWKAFSSVGGHFGLTASGQFRDAMHSGTIPRNLPASSLFACEFNIQLAG